MQETTSSITEEQRAFLSEHLPFHSFPALPEPPPLPKKKRKSFDKPIPRLRPEEPVRLPDPPQIQKPERGFFSDPAPAIAHAEVVFKEEDARLLVEEEPKKKGGRPKGVRPELPARTITEKHLVVEEYNHHRIRKEAQMRSRNAFKALDEILDPDGRLHHTATPAQVLKAAEMVLDRAGDRPAVAPADDSTKTQHYIILDKSVLPSAD